MHGENPRTTPPLIHCGRYLDIAAALAERLHGEIGREILEGRGTHLLVPSRSAAAGVARALLALRPEGFAGIYFNTPDLLAQRILNMAGEFPPPLSDTQRKLLLKKAVASADHPLLGTAGMDSMIGRSHRDIRDSGASLDQFEARIRRLSGPIEERHTALLAASRLYEEYLHALAIPGPPALIDRAIQLLDEGSPSPPQIVFGFYDMTGLQEKLLEALGRRGLIDSVWVPVPLIENELPDTYAYARGFFSRARKRYVGAHAVPSSRGPAQRSIRSSATPREEIRELCRSVRTLIDNGVSIDDIGIVSRSIEPDSTRLARQYAREYGFEIAAREERLLRSHRIGRAIHRILEIEERDFPRSLVIELLRDGVSNSAVFRPRDINALDRATRKYQIAGGAGETLTKALAGIEQRERRTIGELATYAAAVAGVQRICAGIPSAGTGEQWSGILRGLIALFRPATEQDLRAIEAIELLAGELEAIGRVKLTLTSQDIAAAIDDVTISSPMRVPAVWFGDVMTMRGRSFRHLFVFGMQEDRLPQRRVPDPLLSDRERSAADLPAIGDGRLEEEMLLQLMFDAAIEDVVLSFARSNGFGKVLRSSSFLGRAVEGWSVEVDAEEIPAGEAVLSDLERRIATLIDSPERFIPPASLVRKLRLAGSAGTDSSYDGYIALSERAQKEVRRRLETVSPTWFEDFGECPQKFLFRRLLRADELEDPEHEHQINHRDKGGLDHRILERFYRETASETLFGFDAGSSSELPKGLRASLHRIIDEEFARFDVEYPPFNRRIRNLERVTTRTNLERFILGDLEEMATSEYRPAHFEFSFGTDRNGPADHEAPVTIDLEGLSISFRGSIDRIDRKGELYYRVVDYKSGTASGHTTLGKKIDEGRKLQLALYALSVSSIFDAEPSRISGTVRPIGTDRPKASHTFELGERHETLVENLSLFSSAILAGQFPAMPDDEGACRYCTMKLSCRSRHDPEERRRMRRYKNAIELLREGEDD